MSLQPKIRKYRLSFRNKTRIFNRLSIDIRIRKLRNKSNFKLTTKRNNLLYKTGPELVELLSVAPLPLPCFKKARQGKQGSDLSFLNQKLLVNFSNRVSQITFIQKEEVKTLKANAGLDLSYTSSSKTEGAKPYFTFPVRKSVHLHSQTLCLALKKQGAAKGSKAAVNSESLLINRLIDSANIVSPQNSSNTSHTSAVIDKVKFGSCGFYFCSSGTISSKFIDTIRLIIARKLKKTGRFWIRVCPDTPVTARSAETRMGRGKGAISHYEAKIRPGQMFIEFSGVTQENIKQIHQQLTKKSALPISLLF